MSEIAQMIWGAEPTPHIFQANVARDGPHSMQFRFLRALNKMKNNVPPNDVERDETVNYGFVLTVIHLTPLTSCPNNPHITITLP